MIPVQFDYSAPKSIEEAVANLKGDNIYILAGGLSLLTQIKQRCLAPSKLVDLRLISDLKGIKIDKEQSGLVIGSMTTYDEIASHNDVRNTYSALAEAASSIGDAQVRNRGTIGGNLANNNSASDLPPAALALEAKVSLVGSGGMRIVSVEEFLTDQSRTSHAHNEIVTAIHLPRLADSAQSAYEKFKNPASSYALCGIAVLVDMRSDKKINKCRVAVTGAGEYAVRLKKVEQALEGQEPGSDSIAAAAQRVKDGGITFVSDLHASSEYRAHLTEVLTERALRRAVGIDI